MGNCLPNSKLRDRFSFLHLPSRKCERNDRGDDVRCFHVQKCCVCMTKRSDVVLYRCGHICMCFVCARVVRKNYRRCPMCRKKIFDILRFYT